MNVWLVSMQIFKNCFFVLEWCMHTAIHYRNPYPRAVSVSGCSLHVIHCIFFFAIASLYTRVCCSLSRFSLICWLAEHIIVFLIASSPLPSFCLQHTLKLSGHSLKHCAQVTEGNVPLSMKHIRLYLLTSVHNIVLLHNTLGSQSGFLLWQNINTKCGLAAQ